MCSMEIPATARKCPYCHHWERWFSRENPQAVVLLVGIPMYILFAAVMESVKPGPFREPEPFAKHSNKVKIVESKIEFGEDHCGPAVIVVGKAQNLSPVDWKDVGFHVEFFDPKGGFLDTGKQEPHTWRLPAGQESGFKISFHRKSPQKDYARHEVRIVSAVDSRGWR